MDVQLQELIDKIKKEGVQSAEKHAAEIVADAQRKADDITAEAKRHAAEIVDAARTEAAQAERTGKDAMEQAARDLLLSVEKRLTSVFSALIREEAAEQMNGGLMKDLVLAVVSGWSNDAGADLTVLVPPDQLAAVEEYLRVKLSDRVKSGVSVLPSQDVDAGFRVEVDQGAAYYGFTAEEIAEALSERLNPRIAETVRSAAGKKE